MALTHPEILKIEPTKKRRRLRTAKVAGLYWVCSRNRPRRSSWCVRYRHGLGRPHKLTPATFPGSRRRRGAGPALAAILKAKKGESTRSGKRRRRS